MPVRFQFKPVTIPPGTGRRNITESHTFPSRVLRAGVALNGYKFDYLDSDHHINVVEADTDLVSTTDSTVKFNVQCQYADKNFDDRYEGVVQVLIIADTAA
jgi:hypothetical protein